MKSRLIATAEIDRRHLATMHTSASDVFAVSQTRLGCTLRSCATALVLASALVAPASADGTSAVDPPPAVPPASDAEGAVPIATSQSRQFVVVPIPQSNPTLGTGLVLAGMYFYSQSAEQARAQPASSLQAFGLYTDNDSRAFGAQLQTYSANDQWRLSALAANGTFNLDFFGTGTSAGDPDISVGWKLEGTAAQTKLSYRIADDWFVGGKVRYVSVDEKFELSAGSVVVPFASDVKVTGGSVVIERDTRDNSFNAYRGSLLEIEAGHNWRGGGRDGSYNGYTARYRWYTPLSEKTVVALEGRACRKTSDAPLFDLCFLQLRGSSLTRYIDRTSFSTQAEFRARVAGRFGVVAFAGAGAVARSLGDVTSDDIVTTFGAGVRYMVLQSQRINLRVDAARSAGSTALYVSVGEAF